MMNFIEAAIRIDEGELYIDPFESVVVVQMTVHEFRELKELMTQYCISSDGVASKRKGENIHSLSDKLNWVTGMGDVQASLNKIEEKAVKELQAENEKEAERKKENKRKKIKDAEAFEKQSGRCYFWNSSTKECQAEDGVECQKTFALNQFKTCGLRKRQNVV
jgi:hypothetical protein